MVGVVVGGEEPPRLGASLEEHRRPHVAEGVALADAQDGAPLARRRPTEEHVGARAPLRARRRRARPADLRRAELRAANLAAAEGAEVDGDAGLAAQLDDEGLSAAACRAPSLVARKSTSSLSAVHSPRMWRSRRAAPCRSSARGTSWTSYAALGFFGGFRARTTTRTGASSATCGSGSATSAQRSTRTRQSSCSGRSAARRLAHTGIFVRASRRQSQPESPLRGRFAPSAARAAPSSSYGVSQPTSTVLLFTAPPAADRSARSVRDFPKSRRCSFSSSFVERSYRSARAIAPAIFAFAFAHLLAVSGSRCVLL